MRNRPVFLFFISRRRLALIGVLFAGFFCLSLLLGGASALMNSEIALQWPVIGPPRGAQTGKPPELPPELLSARPLQGLVIAVDPGHGGSDRGVCHFPDELIEKEINLDMAGRLKTLLEAAGAQVLLTRAEDTYLSLDERAEAANKAGAHLFLSLHVNRIPGHPECFGAQTFYFPGSPDGERLAALIQEELIKADPENYRDPLPGSYRVLRLTTMPGALVEIGFMTNERDRALMATDEYRNRIAQAIMLGVIRFVGQRSITAEKDGTRS